MIGAAVALGALGAGAIGAYYPNAWLFGQVIGRGSRTGHDLYLTFDDGPNPEATDRILGVLAEEQVPAAFFMVGEHVRRFPDVARRVRAAGHEIGNHTDTHCKLHRRGPNRIRAELSAAHRTIVDQVGIAPRIFRAPHGYRNPFVGAATHRHGYQTLGWTFGVWDSDRPGTDRIRCRTRKHLRSGAIILLHDGDGSDPYGDRRQTAEALPGIIRDARALGYTFRPLEALFRSR